MNNERYKAMMNAKIGAIALNIINFKITKISSHVEFDILSRMKDDLYYFVINNNIIKFSGEDR